MARISMDLVNLKSFNVIEAKWFNPYPSVAFHMEISRLIYSAK